MFRMFYHMPIDIPFECDWKLYGINILKDIVDLAELYCSIHSIAGQIKGQIVDWMNEGGRMEGKDEDYQQLITFILVTAKIHSYSLFSDAFVHMVGLWSSYRHISNSIPDNIRRLIDQEYIRLHEITAEVDRKLGYYLTKAPDLEVRGALEQAFAYYQKKPLLRSFYQRVAKIRGDWAERNLHSLVNPLLVSNLRYYKSDAYRYLVCTKRPRGSKPWKDGDFEW
ncbi:hypothetical protein BDD12DRAFT_53960 [Trichophaea hybrida]|nr:hypothetical protein BDD12DRAFT_53960 [Trichophaea hybrida]